MNDEDIVLVMIQSFFSVKGVEVLILRVERYIQLVLEDFLVLDPIFTVKQKICFHFFQLLD